MVRDSPICERASVHQMAFWHVGMGVAVGCGNGVAVGLLAMMRCTSATAVRRTLVACAAGESGETLPLGALHASAASARRKMHKVTSESPRVTRASCYLVRK